MNNLLPRSTLVAALVVFASGCCRCPTPTPPGPAGSTAGVPVGRNAAPRISALYATANGALLRVVQPGATVRLEAAAEDPDGDALAYSWRAAAGEIQLTEEPGAVLWTAGERPGAVRIGLTVSDGRGGAADRSLAVQVDTVVTFAGRVLDPAGRPVVGATVSVGGRETSTGEEGGFRVLSAQTTNTRYLVTIEHPGYGLYSQVVDSPVDGLDFTLTPGTTVLADPTQAIVVQDTMASQCSGPLSAQVDWALYPRQREAHIYDSSGQPWIGPVPPEVTEALQTYEQAIPCSPGISVAIPANTLVDSLGQVPDGNVLITVATADSYAPGGMPGDYSIYLSRRSFGMQSFGAGTVTAYFEGSQLGLTPDAEMRLTVPVSPLHLMSETRLDSVMPFLLYDAEAADWLPTWDARLRADRRAYEVVVNHLSAFNTDLIKVDQSCMRIESAGIAGDYTLEATIPLPNSAPSIRSYPVDNSPETLHALYNLPSTTWVVLVPFRQETNGPVPLGTFVVNTGPPQSPTTPNRPDYPYGACQSEIGLAEVPGETVIVADGTGHDFGPLPVVFYALTEPTGMDIYPLDPVSGSYSLCALFDTGATRLFINGQQPPNRVCGPNFGDSDTGHLNLTSNATVNVRLNGLATQDSNGGIPMGPPGTQFGAEHEVQGVTAEPRSDLNVTLLGTPITTASVAVIDYTTTITTVTSVVGPDISLHAPGAAVPQADVTLTLQRFGLPERFLITGVEFAEGTATYSDGGGVQFNYDTGTTPTIVGDALANALALQAGAGRASCLGGTNNLYDIDSVTMTGAGGVYRVVNAAVCWRQSSLAGPYQAVIGSNLFDQVTIVFDGVQNTLGIVR